MFTVMEKRNVAFSDETSPKHISFIALQPSLKQFPRWWCQLAIANTISHKHRAPNGPAIPPQPSTWKPFGPKCEGRTSKSTNKVPRTGACMVCFDIKAPQPPFWVAATKCDSTFKCRLAQPWTEISNSLASVCVCACVFEKERERERESCFAAWKIQLCAHM